VAAGPYGGPTSQSRSLSFNVSPDSSRVTDLRFVLTATCDEGWTMKDTDWNGSFSIRPDRTFGSDFSRTDGGNSYTGALRGSFDPATGNASGTMHVEWTWATAQGPVHCKTGDVSWTALKQ
jgi:hypothetical protein